MRNVIQNAGKWGPFALSASAMLVLLLALTTGWGRGVNGDEGGAAHLWQLFMVLQFPLIFVFLLTADWRRPFGVGTALVLQVVALTAAAAPVFLLHL